MPEANRTSRFSPEEKSWLINKISGFYKREIYFQTLDLSYFTSALKFAFSAASTFIELESELRKLNLDTGLNFVRKGSKPKEFLYFKYPPLHFQCKCLYLCWDELRKIQTESGEDISKAIAYQRDMQFLEEHDENEDLDSSTLDVGRSCFGNKPNLNVSVEALEEISLQEEEERKAFPLAVNFKFEYNSFRKKIIKKCEHATGKKGDRNANRDVVFVQTDLKSFFHNLEIVPLIHFFKQYYPWATNLAACLTELNERFKHEDLPIGWILSRFISNVVVQHFHKQFRPHLGRNLVSSLSKAIDYGPNQPLQVPKKFDLKIEDVISFVDDFVFLVSVPSQDHSLTPDAIATQLIKEAQSLLNKVIPGNREIEFYSAIEHKTKIYRLDVDSITTLKSNFAFFKTADEYFLEDPDIRARIDDVLLPSDNDLTLNQNEQFRRNLVNLQRLVISNQDLAEKEIEDLLSQIKLKVEKTGAKYVRSVFGLLRLIVISDSSRTISKTIRQRYIPELFKKCKKGHNFSSDWLKFFSGYFNLLRALDFEEQDRDLYFKLLSEAISAMKEKSGSDVQLLQLVRNDSVFQIMLETGLISCKSKAIKPQSTGYSSTLNELLDKRYSMIHFLAHMYGSTSRDKFVRKKFASLWMPNVVHQLLLNRRELDPQKLFSFIDELPGTAERKMFFDFGASRLFSAALPLIGKDEAIVLLEELTKRGQSHELSFFASVLSLRESYEAYFKMDEHLRVRQALSQLFSDEKDDPVFKILNRLNLRPLDLLSAYFISLRLNSELDFLRYLGAIGHKPESNLISPWSGLPITFQKVGIHLSAILREIFSTDANATEEFVSVDLMQKIQAMLFESEKKSRPRKSLRNRDGLLQAPNFVDLDDLVKLFDKADFRERPFKVTLAPLSMRHREDLDFEKGFQYTPAARRSVDIKIRNAIDEAIKQDSSFLVFPELSIPRAHLQSYLRLLAGHQIVLVGGLEYAVDTSGKAYNSTLISVPVQRSRSPGGRPYMVFEQLKNFPSAEENHYLRLFGFQYKPGTSVFVFKSSFWGDFSVLTCSDFLSLGFRWLLQGEVQSVFVPAQNKDSVTYDHMSESSIRDLHCMAIVCNNPVEGSSHCYAPYYDRAKREKFKRVGKSDPECHTFSIDPRLFRETQLQADPLGPFRNPEDKCDEKWGKYTEFKQLPPDWGNW